MPVSASTVGVGGCGPTWRRPPEVSVRGALPCDLRSRAGLPAPGAVRRPARTACAAPSAWDRHRQLSPRRRPPRSGADAPPRATGDHLRPPSWGALCSPAASESDSSSPRRGCCRYPIHGLFGSAAPVPSPVPGPRPVQPMALVYSGLAGPASAGGTFLYPLFAHRAYPPRRVIIGGVVHAAVEEICGQRGFRRGLWATVMGCARPCPMRARAKLGDNGEGPLEVSVRGALPWSEVPSPPLPADPSAAIDDAASPPRGRLPNRLSGPVSPCAVTRSSRSP